MENFTWITEDIDTTTKDNCLWKFTNESILAYQYTSFGRIFILVLVPLISAFGLFGNISFLYVVYKGDDMRTITNFYLANLAVADACLLVSGGVQYLWSYTLSSGIDYAGFTIDSRAGCALTNMLIYLCYFASVFLVTLVTVERYFAVCHTVNYKVSRKRAIMLCSASWMIALIFAVLELVGVDVGLLCVEWPPELQQSNDGFAYQIPTCINHCALCWTIIVWVDLIQYSVAVPAVIFMTSAMVLQLRRTFGRGRVSKSSQAIIHLVRMLLINATIFFVCLTPFEITNLNSLASKNNKQFLTGEQKNHFVWLGRMTMLLNSAINPVVYSTVNPAYRKAFRRVCSICPNASTQSNAGKSIQQSQDYELNTRSSGAASRDSL